MIRRLKHLLANDQRGGVMIEAAVIMPFLLFVMLGGVEIVRFALLQQKLNRTAVSMADLVAQAEDLTANDLDSLFAAVQFVAQPFELGAQGRVIVSSVSATGANPPKVDWQRFGAGTANETSELGVAGANASLPTGFLVRAGESMIYSEVIYNFEPLIFPQVMAPTQLRHRAVFRPRFGALTTLEGG